MKSKKDKGWYPELTKALVEVVKEYDLDGIDLDVSLTFRYT